MFSSVTYHTIYLSIERKFLSNPGALLPHHVGPRELPGPLVSVSPEITLRLQASIAMSVFLCGCKDLNSGPHVCMASPSSTEPSAQTLLELLICSCDGHGVV